jgi:hypothetical protein
MILTIQLAPEEDGWWMAWMAEVLDFRGTCAYSALAGGDIRVSRKKDEEIRPAPGGFSEIWKTPRPT